MNDLWFFAVALPIALLLFLASLFDRPVKVRRPRALITPNAMYFPYAAPAVDEDGHVTFTITLEPQPGSVALYFELGKKVEPAAEQPGIPSPAEWSMDFKFETFDPGVLAAVFGLDSGSDGHA